jgi:hypothetical protein
VEFKEKIVTQIQEKVRTVTKIVTKPDGTTETVIDERVDRDTKIVSSKKTKPKHSEWSIIATIAPEREFGSRPIYGIGLQTNLILGLSGGFYARSDAEVGLIVSYSF